MKHLQTCRLIRCRRAQTPKPTRTTVFCLIVMRLNKLLTFTAMRANARNAVLFRCGTFLTVQIFKLRLKRRTWQEIGGLCSHVAEQSIYPFRDISTLQKDGHFNLVATKLAAKFAPIPLCVGSDIREICAPVRL